GGPGGLAAGAALCGVALAVGFPLGYPAEVGAAATVAFASLVSVIVIRDLAARAELHARPRRRAPLGEPLAQLSEVDKTLSAALSSGLGDRDLRSLLRPIAATRLARRGVDLDRHEAEGSVTSRRRALGAGRRRGFAPCEYDLEGRAIEPDRTLGADLDVELRTEVDTVGARILDELERAILGKRDALELILLSLLADGHVL